MREYRHHTFIGVVVEVMNLVPLVDDVGHHVGRGGVDDSRRYHIEHITVVFIFGHAQFLVGVELPHSCKVNVTSKDRNANGFFGSKVL